VLLALILWVRRNTLAPAPRPQLVGAT
jgi:hypothetical protein